MHCDYTCLQCFLPIENDMVFKINYKGDVGKVKDEPWYIIFLNVLLILDDLVQVVIVDSFNQPKSPILVNTLQIK